MVEHMGRGSTGTLWELDEMQAPPLTGIVIFAIGKGEGHELKKGAHAARPWRHVCKGSARCMKSASEPGSRRAEEFGSRGREELGERTDDATNMPPACYSAICLTSTLHTLARPCPLPPLPAHAGSRHLIKYPGPSRTDAQTGQLRFDWVCTPAHRTVITSVAQTPSMAPPVGGLLQVPFPKH